LRSPAYPTGGTQRFRNAFRGEDLVHGGAEHGRGVRGDGDPQVQFAGAVVVAQLKVEGIEKASPLRFR
jgi:hypothetical protein